MDTDILIDVALDRTPFFDSSARVFDLAEKRIFNAYIAWHSLSNFFYIVSSNGNEKLAKSFIREMLQFVSVAPVRTEDALYASAMDFPDFEDALQVASARACRAQKIITRNLVHYRKSPIPAIDPKELIVTFNIK